MSNNEKLSVDRWLLIQWILATTVGGVIGQYGVATGILQWLVLRRRIFGTGWWVLATIVGMIITTFLGDIFYMVGGIYKLAAPALGGVLCGSLQWLILRRYFFLSAWWIVATALSFTVGEILWLSSLDITFGALPSRLGLIVSATAGGLAIALGTGLALIWLLRHPRPEAKFITSEDIIDVRNKLFLGGLVIAFVVACFLWCI